MSIIPILGAITVLLFIIALILFICDYNGAALGFTIAGSSFFGVFVLVGIIVGVCCNTPNTTLNNTPTAIDVYRGKTTLEITYRDSVAVDSVVAAQWADKTMIEKAYKWLKLNAEDYVVTCYDKGELDSEGLLMDFRKAMEE